MLSDVQGHALTAAQRARMYVRACVHAPTHVWDSMHDSSHARQACARLHSFTHAHARHSFFHTCQNNQAHMSNTGRHATGHGYRAIAAMMPETLKPNETTLQILTQSVKLNNHTNTTHSPDKMFAQPNSKHHKPRRHSCGQPSTLSSTTRTLQLMLKAHLLIQSTASTTQCGKTCKEL